MIKATKMIMATLMTKKQGTGVKLAMKGEIESFAQKVTLPSPC